MLNILTSTMHVVMGQVTNGMIGTFNGMYGLNNNGINAHKTCGDIKYKAKTVLYTYYHNTAGASIR